MYRIRRLMISNFGLYVEVKINFDKLRLVHVSGQNWDVPGASANMTAKTTMLNALTWTLYGCNTIGKALYGEIIHHGADVCTVTVWLTSDDGEDFIVTRVRRNTSRPGVPTVTLEVDGESGIPETMQVKVDARLGPKDLFLAAHIFGYDEEYVPFANRSDREQKSLFDLLVSAEDLDAARTRAESALRSHTEYVDALQQAIDRMEKNVVRLKATVDTAAAISADTQQALDNEITQLRKEHVASIRKRDELIPALRKWESQYNKAVDGLMDAKDKLRTACIAERAEEAAITKANVLIKALDKERNSAQLVECEVCGSVVTAAFLAQRKISYTLGNIYVRNEALEKARADITIYREQLTTYEAQHEEAEREFNSLREAVDTFENSIRALASNVTAAERKQAALHEADTHRGARLAYVAATHELGALREAVEDCEREADTLEFWRAGFGPQGIRAYRLDLVTPLLNEIAAGYSNQLFGDGTHVVYSTQTQIKSGEFRDRFSVTLADKEGVTITTALSAGQAMRRDLIHLFAIVDLAGRLGKRTVRFLAFDESLRTLDQVGKDVVLDILRQHLDEARTILCLEHDFDMADKFDQAICVVRKLGKSTVELL